MRAACRDGRGNRPAASLPRALPRPEARVGEVVVALPVLEVRVLPVRRQRHLGDGLRIVAHHHLLVEGVLPGEAGRPVSRQLILDVPQRDASVRTLQPQGGHVHDEGRRYPLTNTFHLDRRHCKVDMPTTSVARAAPKPGQSHRDGEGRHLARDVASKPDELHLPLHRMRPAVVNHALLDPVADMDTEQAAFEEIGQVAVLLVKGYPLHISLAERDSALRAIPVYGGWKKAPFQQLFFHRESGPLLGVYVNRRVALRLRLEVVHHVLLQELP
mmetsp:Transcript_94106/g.293170  ORF Transcript_94106/g.293170 Transcript_94106/m.293170 type:complete len:272 (+) Transcript_94106:1-816(+)|eukprot:CAMPEP_0204586000 /NCGR_PEP_ID=MMETSP0661-20131031/47239_1 /ASSEMBLY_ACC=CAM_ASM_000606 /TAXON_ID=109239 /ORGANISM="Alexandrium margalefi, Strain AMGDE01CS-322" /LENGTH=271 /DNA_ID=CAMNT_0051595603 /DNA_START=1 /DNA_END=816 /DNA_ORIENTATION=+